MSQIIRDIYESGQAAILLVGEERLPQKLLRWERFHGRILEWVQAVPCDLRDAAALAGLYCRGIEIAPDLLTQLINVTHGSARRISVNLEKIRKFARGEGLTRITLADWGDQPLYTGQPPRQRGGAR